MSVLELYPTGYVAVLKSMQNPSHPRVTTKWPVMFAADRMAYFGWRTPLEDDEWTRRPDDVEPLFDLVKDANCDGERPQSASSHVRRLANEVEYLRAVNANAQPLAPSEASRCRTGVRQVRREAFLASLENRVAVRVALFGAAEDPTTVHQGVYYGLLLFLASMVCVHCQR